MQRFAVNADLLNHPIFIELLNGSAQKYGYEQKGVLHIPCHVAVFESVLHALRSGRRGPASSSSGFRSRGFGSISLAPASSISMSVSFSSNSPLSLSSNPRLTVSPELSHRSSKRGIPSFGLWYRRP